MKRLLVLCLLAAAPLPVAAQKPESESPEARVLKTLKYRSIVHQEVSSLSGGVSRTTAPPTEGLKLRLHELKAETNQAVAELNQVIAGPIADPNATLGGMPRIITGPDLK